MGKLVIAMYRIRPIQLECYTVICIDFTYTYCIVCVLSVEVSFDIPIIKEMNG